MKFKVWPLLFFFGFVLTSRVLGEAVEVSPALKYSTTSYLGVLFRTTVSLLFILGLIYLLTRIFLKKSALEGRQKNFKIFHRLFLEPQVALYLVKVGRRVLLLGVGGKRISLLESYPEEDWPSGEIMAESQSGKFSDFLNKFSGRLKEQKNED